MNKIYSLLAKCSPCPFAAALLMQTTVQKTKESHALEN
jgi:hypothetical protein